MRLAEGIRDPRQYSALLAVSKLKLRESSPLLGRVIAGMSGKLRYRKLTPNIGRLV
jgi:hypothetical protein